MPSKSRPPESLSFPDLETGNEAFRAADTVAVIILNPSLDKVLLKTRKKDNQRALVSGSGPFEEHPGDPDTVANIEIRHSLGLSRDLAAANSLWRAFVDGRVAVYVAVVGEKEALNPSGKSRDRTWVDIASAASSDLAFGQQRYIKQLIDSTQK